MSINSIGNYIINAMAYSDGSKAINSAINSVQENKKTGKKINTNTKIQLAEIGLSAIGWFGLSGFLAYKHLKNFSLLKKAILYPFMAVITGHIAVMQVGILEAVRESFDLLNGSRSKPR